MTPQSIQALRDAARTGIIHRGARRRGLVEVSTNTLKALERRGAIAWSPRELCYRATFAGHQLLAHVETPAACPVHGVACPDGPLFKTPNPEEK